MAIPSSGAISLTTVQTEFGGSNPIGINEYYAGGAYVAAGTSGTNGPVPSSGQIALSNFYGTSAVIPNYLTWLNTAPATSNPLGSYTYASSVGGFTYWCGNPGDGGLYVNITKVNNATGAVVWSKNIGTAYGGSVTYKGSATSVTDSAGNTYVIGKPNGGAISVVKIDSSGATVAYGLPAIAGDNTYGDCLCARINSTGTTIYFGSTTSTLARLISLDTATLTFNWVRSLNVTLNGIRTMAIDSADNIYFNIFYTLFKYNSAGGLIFQKNIVLNGETVRWINGIGTDSSNNVYLLNDTFSVAKFDSTVTTAAWCKKFSGTSNGYPYGFAVTTTGTSVVYGAWTTLVGGVYQTPAAQITGISSSGTLLYSNTLSFGTSTTFTMNADDSSYFMSGNFYGTSSAPAFYNGSLYLRLPADGTATGGYILGNSSLYYGGAGGITLANAATSAVTGSYTPATPTVLTVSASAPANLSSANSWSGQLVTASTTKGSAVYTQPGSYTWIAPSGVTSVSAVLVGGGGGGSSSRGSGGGGGGLAYINNKAVTAGSSYTVTVGAGGRGGTGGSPNVSGTDGGQSGAFGSIFANGGFAAASGSGGGTPSGTYTAGFAGGVGGSGGSIAGGGGGAAGYTAAGGSGGAGGVGGNNSTGGGGGGGGGGQTGGVSGGVLNGTFGGGVGLVGLGSNGLGKAVTTTATTAVGAGGGSYGLGGSYQYANFGAGGAGGAYQPYYYGPCCCYYEPGYEGGGQGVTGGVRIIWPGSSRSFPSTDVGGP